MAEKKIPQDMGKKIADALKAQDESDELFVDEISAEDFLHADDSIEEFEEILDTPKEPYLKDDSILKRDEKPAEGYTPIFKVDQSEIDDNPELKLTIDAEDNTDEFEMPNNINVLKRLIAQLPSGVPKQTGAQIIRQTIEALGIPMKSVLQDAQRAKDCLNSSIKDCTFTVQEYKSNIRNLEKQSLSYQKQLAKLNDIIGLFVYGEKNAFSPIEKK